jgi:hypothetical protein
LLVVGDPGRRQLARRTQVRGVALRAGQGARRPTHDGADHREREEAAARLAKTRDIAAWQATMTRLDLQDEVARRPRHQHRLPPSEVVAYLRSLPTIWLDSGPEARQALANALFARLEVPGSPFVTHVPQRPSFVLVNRTRTASAPGLGVARSA